MRSFRSIARARWTTLGKLDVCFTPLSWALGIGVFEHHQAGLSCSVGFGPVILIASENLHQGTPNDGRADELEHLRGALEYIVGRGYTGASYVAREALLGPPYGSDSY